MKNYRSFHLQNSSKFFKLYIHPLETIKYPCCYTEYSYPLFTKNVCPAVTTEKVTQGLVIERFVNSENKLCKLNYLLMT